MKQHDYNSLISSAAHINYKKKSTTNTKKIKSLYLISSLFKNKLTLLLIKEKRKAMPRHHPSKYATS